MSLNEKGLLVRGVLDERGRAVFTKLDSTGLFVFGSPFLLLDRFTGINGSAVGHIPDINPSGKSYIMSDFSNGVSTWNINNNRITTPDGDCYMVMDVGQADVTIQVTLITTNAIQIVFRRNATDKSYLYAEFNTGGMSLYHVVPNTNFNNIGNVSYAGISPGAIAKVVLTGSTIDVYMNGTKVLTVTSTINQTSTTHGIGSGIADNIFDDLTITGSAVTTSNPVDSGFITFAGDTTLTSNPNMILGGSTSISGDTTLTGIANQLFNGSVNLTGDTTLSTIGTLINNGIATLSGETDLSITGTSILGGIVNISGDSTINAVGTVVNNTVISVDLTAQSNLNPIGNVLVGVGAIVLNGDSTLSIEGYGLKLADSNLTAQTTLNAVGTNVLSDEFTLIADSFLYAESSVLTDGDILLSAEGEMSCTVDFRGIMRENTRIIPIVTIQTMKIKTEVTNLRIDTSISVRRVDNDII